MLYEAVQCRLATRIGERYTQGAWWGTCAGEGVHYQSVDWPTQGIDDSWTPAHCDKCGLRFDEAQRVKRGAGTHSIWDTPSGELEPGCLYWANWLDHSDVDRDWPALDGSHPKPDDARCFHGWTNCEGLHLQAVCPNGGHWDIDSRASNCTLPDDQTHRCWIRHGDLPVITVDKSGLTCAAGAGSILAGDYHGFIQNGAFTAG
jgi:hypothetical protein